MNLIELLERHSHRPAQSVPEWMLGCFRRRSISFANGETDRSTIVYWFQSRTFTIDLRLPIAEEQAPALELSHYSQEQLNVLANYEGWVADSQWDGAQMSWQNETSLQVHNRWPEPAELHRIGNCMIEFAPSGAYVEDWRSQLNETGPLIGLRLIEESSPVTGQRFHRGGGLIVCGNHAALVLGRSEALEPETGALPELVAEPGTDSVRLQQLFNFETSVAQGSLDTGYTVVHSTCPERVGQALLNLDGFEWLSESQRFRQIVTIDGQLRERLFELDCADRYVNFSSATDTSAEVDAWFEKEAETLTRYTEVVR